jgi:dual specificity tyrosine-phosphorylation-regulated kinase 1
MERFQLGNLVGKGSFGQVVQAYDLRTREWVALKIIKGRKAFFQQAQTEIEILAHLNREDPEDKYGVVRMKEHFVHKGHQCIVFEVCGFSFSFFLLSHLFLSASSPFLFFHSIIFLALTIFDVFCVFVALLQKTKTQKISCCHKTCTM